MLRYISLVLASLLGGVLVCAGAAARSPSDGPGGASIAAAPRPLVLAQATPAGKPPARTLRSAYVPSLSFSPVFLAVEKGYFQAENVNVNLQIVQSVSDAIAFLGIGQLDLAFGNISDTLFNAISRGVDVKIVSSMSYAPRDRSVLSPTPIFARKALWDSGAVKSMTDLKGRKIALNARGGIVEYQVDQSLKRLGLSIKDVQIETLPFPDMPIALANGAVDGAIMPEPISTAARARGAGVVVDPNPAPGVLITVVLFGKNLLAESEAPVANAALRALRRAANELQTPEAILSRENLAIWSKYTKIPAETVGKGAPYVFARDLALDFTSLLDQQKFLLEGGRISGQLPVERLVDRRFVVRMP